ncbi:SMP-30/gluconolactonase/LRE family protein [Niabella drilacis]|uniref:Gluconolactonase n=1 Tax=Niabella drilacis (strain DSM 25811 / CCM 8410 / CCUG 62505 / LMG 26954 / E90) TaxID=1285928 RepID=A0A1G6S3J0_NIADE|nr:SMP-30/gluconolactonase/LRE family protein [Niabella drilacis]SDD11482.1 gluconolactonase [Niabella drilacis]
MKQGTYQEFKGAMTVWQYPFYTEGPAVDAAGELFVTNLQGGQILRITQEGNAAEWARSSCPNGQMIAANGEHWICDSNEACVKRFDPSGKFSGVLAEGIVGDQMIRCPNDLADDGDGGFFFTDSVRHTGIVGHVDRHGKKRLIAKYLDYPNGIALHPVTHHLFIAESYQNRILVVDLDRASPAPVVLCDLPRHASGKATANLPDGLAFDCFHNLWVAHYGMAGIQLLDEQGTYMGKLETGFLLTSNVYLQDGLLLVTGGSGEPGPGFVQLLKKEESEI